MKRILGALILFLVLAVPIIFGPAWVFTIIASIICIFCMYELYRVILASEARILGIIGTLTTIPVVICLHAGSLPWAVLALGISALIMIACSLVLFERRSGSARDLSHALSGLVYPLLLMSFWISIRCGADGRFWMIFGLLCNFLSDTGAYYCGKYLGHHHLAHRLSPKKTWEGLLGGMLSSLVGGLLMAWLWNGHMGFATDYPSWLFVVLPPCIAGLGLMGDLTASMFKREYNIKDMGNLIPGHGGMLDRMDGIVPVGIFLYTVLKLVVNA